VRKFNKFVFVLGLTALTFSPVLAQAVESIGFAALVKGEVKAIDINGVETQLKSKDQVFENQRIVTLAQSKVQLIFKDDSIFTLGQNAEIKLDKFVYNTETQEGNSLIEATKGLFKFVTGKIAKKNPKQVKINTPFATIGVRGSGGLVDLKPTGEMLMSVTECCLDLTSRGSGETVPLNQVNTFSRVTSPDQAPSTPAETPAEVNAVFEAEVGAFDRAAQKEVTAPVKAEKKAAKKVAKAAKVAVKKVAAAVPKATAPLAPAAAPEPTALETQVAAVNAPTAEPFVAPTVGLEPNVTVDLTNTTQDQNTDGDRVVQTVRRGFAGGIIQGDNGNIVMTSRANAAAVSLRETDGRIVLRGYDAADGYNKRIVASFENKGGPLMEQTNTLISKSTDGFVNNVEAINVISANGALTSSDNLGDTVCTTCQFIEWGAWDTTIAFSDGGSDGTVNTGPIETAAPIHYIVGDITQNLGEKGLTGTAYFSGDMIGAVEINFAGNTGGNVSIDTGTFNADVNLGTRDLVNFDATFAGRTFSQQAASVPIAATQDATFSDTLNYTGPGTGYMNINGALFGANAEEIGGNFNFDITTTGTLSLDIDGAGVFAGVTNFVSP